MAEAAMDQDAGLSYWSCWTPLMQIGK